MAQSSTAWTCSHCTYTNDFNLNICAICNQHRKIPSTITSSWETSASMSHEFQSHNRLETNMIDKQNRLSLTEVKNDTQDNSVQYEQLKRVKKLLKKCSDSTTDSFNFESEDIQYLVDDFMYLLNTFNADDEFEILYHQLGGYCNANNCGMFERNHRNRSTYETVAAELDILDKIHCYFMHSFDMGHRLTTKEKLSTTEPKSSTENNNQLCSLAKLLSNKRKQYDTIHMKDHRLSKRYNQILSANVHIEEKSEINNIVEVESWTATGAAVQDFVHLNDLRKTIDANNTRLYKPGVSFKYGYDGEEHDNIDYLFPQTFNIRIVARRKHPNLKTELISNPIVCIILTQFNEEYRKAQMHFNCFHRKKHFPKLSLDHIIALLIYCNYTDYQYEYSRTFRDNVHQHSDFYTFAVYLYSAVKRQGTRIKDGNIKQFYHGISSNLYLGCYVIGVRYRGPLSTSSAIEVASNFSTAQGMLVEFGAGGEDAAFYIVHSKKYFATSWLSDFPAEREYFFGADNFYKFHIDNIIDIQSNIEYKPLLEALSKLEEITCDSNHYIGSKHISDRVESLITKIIQHQLSDSESLWFNNYERNIIQTYCSHKNWVTIDFSKPQHQFFLTIVGRQDFVVIKILFPNITDIHIRNIKLSAAMLNSIVKEFSNKNSIIRWIRISSDVSFDLECKDMSCKNVLDQFGPTLRDFGVITYLSNRRTALDGSYRGSIVNNDKFDFGKHVGNDNQGITFEKTI